MSMTEARLSLANRTSKGKLMKRCSAIRRISNATQSSSYRTTSGALHPNWLNRSSLTDFERFGDHDYSREELVAEMGAAFLAGYCGIENRTINNSAAYLANWLKALKDDSRMVLVAASQAQKATDLILGVTPSDAAQQNAG